MSNPQEAERSCSCASHWFARGWRCYCFADELLPKNGGVMSVMPSSLPANGAADNLRERRLQLFFSRTSGFASSGGQISTEVGGSEILTWSAHHCNMQQQQVSETALLQSRANTNSGVLRPHMQLPESECRICGGTGCVFFVGHVVAH